MYRPAFLYVVNFLCLVSCEKKNYSNPIEQTEMPERDEFSFSEDEYKKLNFSCVLPIDDATQKLIDGGIEKETERLFERIMHLVDTNNSTVYKVESIRFYMADLTYNYLVTSQIRQYFPYPYPDTTMMEVTYPLPMNASIKADVIAYAPLPSPEARKDTPGGS